MQQTLRSSSRAFTLIELLVTIAIVALLVGFLLVALRGARRGAERAETLNAMRGMMTAYNAYATEHEGRLMPGYIAPDDFIAGGGALDINVQLKNGFDLDSAGSAASSDASSYVWRLAPYMDDNWGEMMQDYGDKQLLARLEVEFDDGSAAGAYGPESINATQLGIARVPSFGLNSIHLGGDSFHGPADNSPWNSGRKPSVATRLSDVLNPTKIIVFAPSQAQNVALPSPTGTPATLGYCELRSPQAYDGGGTLVSQWTIDTVSGSPTEGQIIWGAGGPGGTPIARLNDDLIPISHLDGHVTTETLGRLSVDLSRWIPNALSQQ